MISLSLTAINARSPYHIDKMNEYTFVFSTNQKLEYSISVEEDQIIAGCQTFQFVIRNLSHNKGSYDPFVKTSILAILYEFFDKNNDVLLYICDTSDGREASRNRLFIRWFEQEDIEGRFVIRSANAVVEGEGFYAAIIVQNSHPHLKEIIEEFDYIADNLTEK